MSEPRKRSFDAKPVTAEDCNWVVQNLDNRQTLTVMDAPSPAAYSLLLRVKEHPRLLEWVLNHTTPKTFADESDDAATKEMQNLTHLRERVLSTFNP